MKIDIYDNNFIFENKGRRKLKITIETDDGFGCLMADDFCIHINNDKDSELKIIIPEGILLAGYNADEIKEWLRNQDWMSEEIYELPYFKS